MAIVLNDKMGSVLEGNLAKLARYDMNTLLSSVLSLAVSFPFSSSLALDAFAVNHKVSVISYENACFVPFQNETLPKKL